MSGKRKSTISDFNAAREAAQATPGEPVFFEGILPSGYQASQMYVQLPAGKGLSSYHNLIQGSKVQISSDSRGSMLIATMEFDNKPCSPKWLDAGYNP